MTSGPETSGPETSGRTREPLDTLVHLSAAGVSLAVSVDDGGTPSIVHWGAALGDLSADDLAALALATDPPVAHNAIDVPVRVGILPQLADGWVGTPGIEGARADGSGFSPRLQVRSIEVRGADGSAADITATPAGSTGARSSSEAAPMVSLAAPSQDGTPRAGATQPIIESHGPGTIVVGLEDPDARLAVSLEIALDAHGLVRTRATLTNTGDNAYDLRSLTLTLPIPLEASEVLDFGGRWTKERTPQRTRLVTGTHRRENRRGRTGADAAYVLHAGAPGFDFRTGEVWAIHTAFSGNHVHLAERSAQGVQLLGGGELLLAGEGRLEPGASYESPWVIGSYSDAGLDPIAHRFHRALRARPQHVDTARPVTLNVWEAVYFDHDLARLTDLADRAADLGVERFVLDDGWFGSRRDDTSGLGDWVVSPDAWPDGLAPLVDHVTGLGMQFGLWFEPEMVNEDSDVARAHPEWIMAPSADRLPLESRHQQVLNLSIPEAFDHVHQQMRKVLHSAPISYIKWDHNRDLIEAGTRSTGTAATRAQTLAAYRLLDALKAEFPGLEIESCSSGGARVDLGILERTDRVWVSDCIDPLERQQMNRWTAQLIPLELMGSHIASGVSHTTGRWHTLDFRAATALFGHLGIEWDLARATDDEIAGLRRWIALYKEQRDLLFTGDLVRGGAEDDPVRLTGVVAADGERGLFSVVVVGRSDLATLGRVRLPGLDAERRYRVRAVHVPGANDRYAPAWLATDDGAAERVGSAGTGAGAPGGEGLVLTGAMLGRVGVAVPSLNPESALVLEVTAV